MSEQRDKFDEWWKKNAADMFWYKHRLFLGFDPDKPMTIQEQMYWKKVNRQRKWCAESEDPRYAILNAYSFDKQMFLEKWWDYLEFDDKKDYLLHVWAGKGDGNIYGFDWWLPYFEEVGFITNTTEWRPDEPITLYRGAEPLFKWGMSWTPEIDVARCFADSHSLIEEKKVFETVVQPEHILAIVEGNVVDANGDLRTQGYEYVVNHHELKDIQQIE